LRNTSNRRAELLTMFLFSFRFDMCGPIGTMRGWIGRSEANLVKKNIA
jgi:hypothetical protein